MLVSMHASMRLPRYLSLNQARPFHFSPRKRFFPTQNMSIPLSPPSQPPNFDEHALLSHTHMSKLARRMQRTGHNRWGFAIFRTTYANNDLFTTYLSKIYSEVDDSLEIIGRREAFSPYFYCPVFEDSSSLNGLSKNQIRELFSEWARDATDERDGVGAIRMRNMRAPQYEFCLMVDEECLESFQQAQQQPKPNRGLPKNGKVVVIERDWSPEKYRGRHHEDWTDGESHKILDKKFLEENGEEFERDVPPTIFEEIDGCRSPLVGWMYADIDYIQSLYMECEGNIDENWYELYVRPPGIYPTTFRHEQPWKE
jgi:hypothetical protein